MNKEKKNRKTAAFLALFLGWCGVHRFYLGQIFLGVLHCIFMPLGFIVGIVDFFRFLTMSQEDFDWRYNRDFFELREKADYEPKSRNRRKEYVAPRQKYQKQQRGTRNYREERRDTRKTTASKRTKKVISNRPFKQSGISKFREFDYEGAIEDFTAALEIDPQDYAVYFNLACTYSLMENKTEAFRCLDSAVALGLKNHDRIRQHDALAWLRIQPEYETFANNGFRNTISAPNETVDAPPVDDNLLDSRPDLLDQLKKLEEYRKQGFLTEAEYTEQKKKLYR